MNRFGISGAIALLAVTGLAAPASANYDWTGLYIGANGGAIWNASTLNGEDIYSDKESALFGGEIGFNYQMGRAILGIEGDADVMDVDVTMTCPGFVGSSCHSKQDAVSAIRGRLGIDLFDRVMAYGTGGIAFTDYKFDENIPGRSVSGSGARTGYTLGLGFDYAFIDHMFLGMEFDYFNFGTGGPTGFGLADRTLLAKLGIKF